MTILFNTPDTKVGVVRVLLALNLLFLILSVVSVVFLVGRIGEKPPILIQCDREDIEKVDRAAKVLEGLQKGIK